MNTKVLDKYWQYANDELDAMPSITSKEVDENITIAELFARHGDEVAERATEINNRLWSRHPFLMVRCLLRF